MKLALLLPGYLNCPDWLDLVTIDKHLVQLGYTILRVDACNLWKTGDTKNYSVTNYLAQIKDIIDLYKQKTEEIILVGHSLGASVAIIAGSKFSEVTKVISLCPEVDFNKSVEKWTDTGIRHSKRALPNDPSRYREFDIPKSFVEDKIKYSMPEALEKLNKPLMVLVGMQDNKNIPEDTIKVIKYINNVHLVKIEGMGHSFRKTSEEAERVAVEVEKYLNRN